MPSNETAGPVAIRPGHTSEDLMATQDPEQCMCGLPNCQDSDDEYDA